MSSNPAAHTGGETAEGAVAAGRVERLLSEDVVKQLTTLHRVTRWRMIRQGKFPAPVPIAGRRVAWAESSINRWIAERIAAAA